MWHMVDAVFIAKRSLCYIRHLGKRRKWEISKNGSRPQKAVKNRNSHHIFSKALGQAILRHPEASMPDGPAEPCIRKTVSLMVLPLRLSKMTGWNTVPLGLPSTMQF